MRMSKRTIVVAVSALAAVLVFAAAVKASPDGEGAVSSDSPFYGLDKWFEQVDEALSLSPESQMGKQIAHLNERIAEANAAVERGSAEGIQRAAEAIESKAKDIEQTSSKVDDAGAMADALAGLRLAEETLQGLLADPEMPEESAFGLETALSAVQSSIAIAQQYLDMIPIDVPASGAP